METSIVRQNLMKDKEYRPYCGNDSKGLLGYCHNPRTERRDDGQFICPHCKWISQFPQDFIEQYKKKHNL